MPVRKSWVMQVTLVIDYLDCYSTQTETCEYSLSILQYVDIPKDDTLKIKPKFYTVCLWTWGQIPLRYAQKYPKDL